jgi:hypothetical protein
VTITTPGFVTRFAGQSTLIRITLLNKSLEEV